MLRDGAALGLLRTRVPHFFHRCGWAVCGRHCYSKAKTRDILARYWAEPGLRRGTMNIRLWKHFEMPALMRIYAQNTAGGCGPLARSETYWRWLISRGAFDQIMIALAGPDRLDLNEISAPIAGYAVVRQERVVELLTDPAYPRAGVQLLARACSDAIERRGNEIVLEAQSQGRARPADSSRSGRDRTPRPHRPRPAERARHRGTDRGRHRTVTSGVDRASGGHDAITEPAGLCRRTARACSPSPAPSSTPPRRSWRRSAGCSLPRIHRWTPGPGWFG